MKEVKQLELVNSEMVTEQLYVLTCWIFKFLSLQDTVSSFQHTHSQYMHDDLRFTYIIIGRIWVLLFTLISTVLIHVNLQRENITYI